jgi:hypothetical protein
LPNPALKEGISIANTAIDVQGHLCVTFTATATLTAAIQNCRVYDMSPDILLLVKNSFSVWRPILRQSSHRFLSG